jgi:hypothetical protein
MTYDYLRQMAAECAREWADDAGPKCRAIAEVCRRWLADHAEDAGEPVDGRWLLSMNLLNNPHASRGEAEAMYCVPTKFGPLWVGSFTGRVLLGERVVVARGITRGGLRTMCETLGRKLPFRRDDDE